MADKPTTYTEDEFKRELVKSIERERTKRLTYTIVSGWDRHELVPSLEIKLTGGDAAKLQALGLQIQAMVLEHAKTV